MEQTMHDAVSYRDSCRITKQSQQISISDTNSRPNAAKQAHKTALHTLAVETLTQVCSASLSVSDAGLLQTSHA